eukprot:CAMPEP_0119361936 /NCGR_PEP_ID=MMETSP1334-20130426/9134_1 /TAXON_ID=127549 /ORGANISM="Calcidiscus leptoporus, Strain RCC1130" /LENGTH=65 /DNA_ID=CAMNT_0007377069 /DNA_START=92 /DNA_END=289 /DNA_ORIENTATION=-
MSVRVLCASLATAPLHTSTSTRSKEEGRKKRETRSTKCGSIEEQYAADEGPYTTPSKHLEGTTVD